MSSYRIQSQALGIVTYLLVSTISFTLSILQCNRPAAINLESSLNKEKSWLNPVSTGICRHKSTETAVTPHCISEATVCGSS